MFLNIAMPSVISIQDLADERDHAEVRAQAQSECLMIILIHHSACEMKVAQGVQQQEEEQRLLARETLKGMCAHMLEHDSRRNLKLTFLMPARR